MRTERYRTRSPLKILPLFKVFLYDKWTCVGLTEKFLNTKCLTVPWLYLTGVLRLDKSSRIITSQMRNIHISTGLLNYPEREWPSYLTLPSFESCNYYPLMGQTSFLQLKKKNIKKIYKKASSHTKKEEHFSSTSAHCISILPHSSRTLYMSLNMKWLCKGTLVFDRIVEL